MILSLFTFVHIVRSLRTDALARTLEVSLESLHRIDLAKSFSYVAAVGRT